ncbi:cupin domain-containing protein [bacterium]|nr:MAG: cupin domain-containing protein [bacterium]
MNHTHAAAALSFTQPSIAAGRPCIMRAADLPPMQGGPGEKGAFMLTGEHSGGRLTVASTFVDVNSGPPPHIHSNEEEIFVVQSGAFELLANGQLVVARAGDVAYMSRGEAHRFRGLDSGEPNHFFIIVAPSGFENFLMRWAGLFQNGGAPNMEVAGQLCGEYGISLLPADDAFALPEVPRTKIIPSSKRAMSVLGFEVALLLNTDDTQGRYSMVRLTGAHNRSLPVCQHNREDQAFIIEEGQVEFRLGAETVLAEKGDVVWVPRGHKSGFCIASQSARMVAFMTPGGFDEFFVDAALAEVSGDEATNTLSSLGKRFGVTFS